MEDHQILKECVRLSRKHFPNFTYAAWVDFSRPANQHRFFLINVDEELIEDSWYTSHGKGSGTREKAVRFGNEIGSGMSSLGMMKTAETYDSRKFGYALKLDGLEKGTNDQVRNRAVVMHRSWYVSKEYMSEKDTPGMSLGCITLDPDKATVIINKLKGGSMVYVYR